ncbi:hypothetical protein BC829DRAFT_438936 [Chytridium lagenaria]|nr:hypothetical protein BC829DRAFT_438936 [Chytridium lagenaria]
MVSLTSLIAVIAGVVTVTAAPTQMERRSNIKYPPDYNLSIDCKREGPVEICALNKNGGTNPRLKVTYHNTGYLWPKSSPLSAWVSVNGVSATVGTFTADTSYGAEATSASYEIGKLKDLTFCYRPTVSDDSTYIPPSSGVYTQCPITSAFPLLEGGPQQGYTDWFYNPAPEVESAMVANTGVAWNVQVAVFNGKGQWDSKYGANFRFTF